MEDLVRQIREEKKISDEKARNIGLREQLANDVLLDTDRG